MGSEMCIRDSISYVVSLKKLSEMQGGAISWQNVQFVKKVFIMEIMSAILIEDQIMFGSQTLRRFLARSMEFHRSYMYVLHV